jgi:hypothetical protein
LQPTPCGSTRPTQIASFFAATDFFVGTGAFLPQSSRPDNERLVVDRNIEWWGNAVLMSTMENSSHESTIFWALPDHLLEHFLMRREVDLVLGHRQLVLEPEATRDQMAIEATRTIALIGSSRLTNSDQAELWSLLRKIIDSSDFDQARHRHFLLNALQPSASIPRFVSGDLASSGIGPGYESLTNLQDYLSILADQITAELLSAGFSYENTTILSPQDVEVDCGNLKEDTCTALISELQEIARRTWPVTITPLIDAASSLSWLDSESETKLRAILIVLPDVGYDPLAAATAIVEHTGRVTGEDRTTLLTLIESIPFVERVQAAEQIMQFLVDTESAVLIGRRQPSFVANPAIAISSPLRRDGTLIAHRLIEQ